MSGAPLQYSLTQEMLLRKEFGNGVINVAREMLSESLVHYTFIRTVRNSDEIIAKKSWKATRQLTKEELDIEWITWSKEVNARCVSLRDIPHGVLLYRK